MIELTHHLHHSPIGLDMGAETTEEVAISIIGEINETDEIISSGVFLANGFRRINHWLKEYNVAKILDIKFNS